MERREPVAPGGLSHFGGYTLAMNAPDAERRVALGKWITSTANPLTARVIVNRLWHYHFGAGIVETPSDFGINGGRPSHPELLDWLAAELMEHGWSLKHIHRLILTSVAYRQSGTPDAKAAAIDVLYRHSKAAAAAIRALSDDELDRAAPASLYDDAPVTCQFVLEDHAVRHSYHHLAVIRRALGR